MALRKLEQQFEPHTAQRIRSLIERFQAIEYPRGVSRYYSNELQATLEAGTLLASLCVGCALLEIVVRELLLEHTWTVASYRLDLQSELEAKKHLTFAALIDALSRYGFFDAKDSGLAKVFYAQIRIPVLHGLPQRFVRHHAGESWADLRNLRMSRS